MKKTISVFCTLLLSASVAFSQDLVPNAGFENWTSMSGYSDPVSWSCMNGLTTPMGVYTCMKGTPGAVGSAYLKLVTKTVNGIGIVPGLAASGMLEKTTATPTTGFAYTSRPKTLTGKWQYMAYSGDQGFISVLLSKWNSIKMLRDTIGYTYYALPGMAMSWANFSIPLTYTNTALPDSCIIVLSSSGANEKAPANNSYLYADNLGFSGTVADIADDHYDANISLYPNPSSEKLFVDMSTLQVSRVYYSIVNNEGRQLKSENNCGFSSMLSLDISDIPTGIYDLNIYTEKGIITKKFVKQ